MKILACLLCIFLYSCGEKKPTYPSQKKLNTSKKEAYITEKTPIDTIWLAKALAYEGDTLPKELRAYLKPLVMPEKPHVILFEYQEANLDADPEKEN